jgi:hypothetical protein
MMQTVRTPAVGSEIEIEIELDPSEGDADPAEGEADRRANASDNTDTDAEIEAILAGLTEHSPEDIRRTDRYRCVPVQRR